MERKASLELLAGKFCVCGAVKAKKTAFCGTCYHALPEDLRQGLWALVGNGFEAAYESAIDYLRALGRAA
jgi:hypothetical protein